MKHRVKRIENIRLLFLSVFNDNFVIILRRTRAMTGTRFLNVTRNNLRKYYFYLTNARHEKHLLWPQFVNIILERY